MLNLERATFNIPEDEFLLTLNLSPEGRKLVNSPPVAMTKVEPWREKDAV